MTNEDLTSQTHEPEHKFTPPLAGKLGLITAILTAFGIIFISTQQLSRLLLAYGSAFLNKEDAVHPIFTNQSFALSLLPFAAGTLTAAFVLFASVRAWGGNKKLGCAIAWSLLPALLLTVALAQGMLRATYVIPVFILSLISTACLFISGYRRSTSKLIALSLGFLLLPLPAALAAEDSVARGYESTIGERVLNPEVAKIFSTGTYRVNVDQFFFSTQDDDIDMTKVNFDFSDCTERGEGNNSTEWLRVKGTYFYNVDQEGWLRDDVNSAPVGPLLWALVPSSEQSLARDYGVCKGLQQLAYVTTISEAVETAKQKTYVLSFDRSRTESAADRRAWEIATKVLGLSGVRAVITNEIAAPITNATPALGAFFNAKPQIQVDVDSNGLIKEMRMLIDDKGVKRTIERYHFAQAQRPSIKTPDHQDISRRILLNPEEYISLIKE